VRADQRQAAHLVVDDCREDLRAVLGVAAQTLGVSVTALLRRALDDIVLDFSEGGAIFDRRLTAQPVAEERRRSSGRRRYDSPVPVRTPSETDPTLEP